MVEVVSKLHKNKDVRYEFVPIKTGLSNMIQGFEITS